MTPAEERFASAYYAWKMRYAPDIEPDPVKFNLTPRRGEEIARAIHHAFEMERIKNVTDAAKEKRYY